MCVRLFLFLTVLIIVTCPPAALSRTDLAATQFTLQVASFPEKDQASRFMSRLVVAGEHPLCETVELQGRGYWTRVLVGTFNTFEEARRYGERLVARGLIEEFFVRRADVSQEATRPRRVTQKISDAIIGMTRLVSATLPTSARSNSVLPVKSNLVATSSATLAMLPDLVVTPLPVLHSPALNLAPSVDTGALPRPDAVALGIRMVVGANRSFPATVRQRGGLWITGDAAEGLARLRWIVGGENADLIETDGDGRVQLDRKLLAILSGLAESRADNPLKVASYISSNEGLLLVVQLMEGKYRYCVHFGPYAPTYGKSVEIAGSVNLDNNFDSRINRYRKHFAKLDSERPPKGFDSLVGINPVARWFNLSTNCWVPVGEVTFHELAEAYSKLEFDLDYLEQGGRPGAHASALEREQLLKSQRPAAGIVLTLGANRVLKNEQEIRLFYAEQPGGASQR